jgi:SAM-dependent methyltransferase
MSMLRSLYYALPPSMRFWARRLWYAPLDMWEGISGQRDALTPPRGLIFTGGGDFRAQGSRMVDIFCQYAGLQPQHRVLDIGSGIGRMAVPLTAKLSSSGSYEGFDVIEMGVRWCQKRISSRFPNFQFRYVPLANDLYRADGQEAGRFRFPYSDTDFDFACAISVFTHFLPDEVEQYLRETSRVLKPGGTFCATFFLLNAESERLLPGRTQFSFPHDHGHYRLMDERVRAANVSFREDWLRASAQRCGLRIEAIHYGYWCGREKAECLDFQDVVVFRSGE